MKMGMAAKSCPIFFDLCAHTQLWNNKSEILKENRTFCRCI